MPYTDVTQCNVGVFSLNKWSQQHQQYEFDLTEFRNPQGKPEYRTLFGTDPKVVAYVSQDPRLKAVLDTCHLIAADNAHRNKDYTSFGFRDHHGRWIAMAVAHIVGMHLSDLGFKVHVSHRGIQDAPQKPDPKRK